MTNYKAETAYKLWLHYRQLIDSNESKVPEIIRYYKERESYYQDKYLELSECDEMAVQADGLKAIKKGN